jgi:3-hydroxybutyrate dehydrogenase
MTKPLDEKIALVTGSTSGIGLEIARQLAKAGCRLMINGIEAPSMAEAAITDLRATGAGEIFFSDADLTDPVQTTRLIADTLDSFGAIDILVNNAGVQHVAPIEAFTDENWDRIVEINLSAPFRLIRQAIPAMRANAWGRIINIASVHGLVASPQISLCSGQAWTCRPDQGGCTGNSGRTDHL